MEGCGELGIWGVEGGRVWRTRNIGSGGWKVKRKTERQIGGLREERFG